MEDEYQFIPNFVLCFHIHLLETTIFDNSRSIPCAPYYRRLNQRISSYSRKHYLLLLLQVLIMHKSVFSNTPIHVPHTCRREGQVCCSLEISKSATDTPIEYFAADDVWTWQVQGTYFLYSLARSANSVWRLISSQSRPLWPWGNPCSSESPPWIAAVPHLDDNSSFSAAGCVPNVSAANNLSATDLACHCC